MMSRAVTLFFIVLWVFFYPSRGYSLESRDTHFFFGSFDGHVQINEDPQRAEWQKPEKVVDYLLIKKGDSIADIGAGTGYFTIPFSKQTGDKGKVYAVDVEQRMLDIIKARAGREGLRNIKEVLAKPDDPLLPRSSLDLIFICNTYFNFENKVHYLALLKNDLKKGGRLAIIEHHLTSKHDKPPLHKRTPKERVLEDALKAGFKLEGDLYFLPYQYFLIFRNE